MIFYFREINCHNIFGCYIIWAMATPEGGHYTGPIDVVLLPCPQREEPEAQKSGNLSSTFAINYLILLFLVVIKVWPSDLQQHLGTC